MCIAITPPWCEEYIKEYSKDKNNMKTLPEIIREAKKEYDSTFLYPLNPGSNFMKGFLIPQLTKAYNAGIQSVLEKAKGMKIRKEYEIEGNHYAGYNYEYAIGFNSALDNLRIQVSNPISE